MGPPAPRSLQFQLAMRLGLLFLGATLLAVGALAYETYRTASSLGEQDLMARARDLARAIDQGPDGTPVLSLPPELAGVYGSPTRAAEYAIRDGRGRPVAASGTEIRSFVSKLAPARHEPKFFRLESFGYSGGDYYGLDVKLSTAAGPLDVTVAEAGDLDVLFHAMLADFAKDVAWIVPVFVAATLLVGVLAIRRGLRPLRGAADAAARIEPGSMSVRLSERGVPSEVLPLVTAVNRALDRLEEGFAIQRRFTADAAHELRTPLTIVTGALEVIGGDGELAKLHQDVARMNRLVDQLLRVARLDSLDVDVSGDVDLDEVARETVEYLAPLAVARDRSLAFVGEGRPVLVRGNRHAVADALRNLVENAINHTRPGTEAVVTVSDDGSLSVADRGPGVAVEDRARIFDRFWRNGEARGSGAGLGLAIVLETMKAHGGVVEVGANPGGGARFTLRFRGPSSDRSRA